MKKTTIFSSSAGPTPNYRFVIEVKGLSTGKWCPQTLCEDDSEATVIRTMKAQGSGWMLEQREWHTVPLGK